MSDEKSKAGAVTEEQKAIIEGLQLGADNVAVLSCLYRGQQVGVLTAVTEGVDGEVLLTPVAILCDTVFLEKFGDELLDPTGQKLSVADNKEVGSGQQGVS